jgi:hypothetical protein
VFRNFILKLSQLILDNTFIKLFSINVGDHKTDCATSSINIVQRLAKTSIMARASDLVPIGVAHRDIVANLQMNAPAAIGTPIVRIFRFSLGL